MLPEQNVYDGNVYPRRVIRFTELEGSFVAKLLEGNVLLVDRAKFDMLSKAQQEQVYVARADMEVDVVGL